VVYWGHMRMTTKGFHLFGFVAAFLLLGAGCRPETAPPAKPTPIPPPTECPDVCAAVCAGEPEPAVPQGCAMPMCACDPVPAE
jgi:hypothetical protein